MDNHSDAINVDSEEDDATVEQILKWMKPNIEEKIGIESEAAKIFIESIRGVMRSVDQNSQCHTVPLQYTIQLASQVSKSAYEKIRQIIFLTTRKHANKCESILF